MAELGVQYPQRSHVSIEFASLLRNSNKRPPSGRPLAEAASGTCSTFQAQCSLEWIGRNTQDDLGQSADLPTFSAIPPGEALLIMAPEWSGH